jgi:hypothetical protein
VSLTAASLATLQRAFKEAPELAERELLAAATEATLLVEREVKENIKTGATGLTRASVTSDAFSTPEGPLGVVGSSQLSALVLELGTRPHPEAASTAPRKAPPVDALEPWVRSVLGLGEKEAKSAAFAIAMKIKKHGTKPQRPFGRALESTRAQVLAMYEQAAGRIAAQLGGAA